MVFNLTFDVLLLTQCGNLCKTNLIVCFLSDSNLLIDGTGRTDGGLL